MPWEVIPRIIAPAPVAGETGRKRVCPASIAAAAASSPAAMRSFAKVTTKMLLAVVNPMHIKVPISAGTLICVWVKKSIHITPPSAKGTAINTINGSTQLWNLITIHANRPARTARPIPVKEPVETVAHRLGLASEGRRVIPVAADAGAFVARNYPANIIARPLHVAALNVGIHVENRTNVQLRHDHGASCHD